MLQENGDLFRKYLKTAAAPDWEQQPKECLLFIGNQFLDLVQAFLEILGIDVLGLFHGLLDNSLDLLVLSDLFDGFLDAHTGTSFP